MIAYDNVELLPVIHQCRQAACHEIQIRPPPVISDADPDSDLLDPHPGPRNKIRSDLNLCCGPYCPFPFLMLYHLIKKNISFKILQS